MKNQDARDPNRVFEVIKEIDKLSGRSVFEVEKREDTKVQIRVNESIAPARFKADPLVPGGYMANSLTIRAMRSDIFVLGDSLEDLSAPILCSCGQEFDVQFWKICPYCGKQFK